MGGKASLILNLSIRQMKIDSFKSRLQVPAALPPHSRENKSWFMLNKKLCGSQRRFSSCEEETEKLSIAEMQTPKRPLRIQITVSWLTSPYALKDKSIFFASLWLCGPTWATMSSFLRFIDHTQWHVALDRNPLDE
jgi:hypothetical protein